MLVLLFPFSFVTPTCAAPGPCLSPHLLTTRTSWLSEHVTTQWRRSMTRARVLTSPAAPRTGPRPPWRVLLRFIRTPGRSCTLLKTRGREHEVICTFIKPRTERQTDIPKKHEAGQATPQSGDSQYVISSGMIEQTWEKAIQMITILQIICNWSQN